MRPPAGLLPRLTALSPLFVLIVVEVLHGAQGVPVRSSPGGSITASRPVASTPPRPASGPARRPGLPVRIMAVDHADRRLRYRVVGQLVQRSTDGGRQWATILTP